MQAQFTGGDCVLCGQTLRQGQMLAHLSSFLDGDIGWAHVTCPPVLEQPLCERCGLLHRGEC